MPLPIAESDRSLLGKLGAHSRWSRVLDRTEETRKARLGFDRRFERQVDALDPAHTLSDKQRVQMVQSMRKAYFVGLVLRRELKRRNAANKTKSRRGPNPSARGESSDDAAADPRPEPYTTK